MLYLSQSYQPNGIAMEKPTQIFWKTREPRMGHIIKSEQLG